MRDETLKKLQALCNVDYGTDLVACIRQRIDKAESELARVRGLLQRHGSHTVNCECEYFETGCTCGWEKVSAEYFGTTATIEMCGSGAESADIGKHRG